MRSTLPRSKVIQFEQVGVQLMALHQEFAVLSKSKPDNAVNTLKLRFVNEKLRAANDILGAEAKPFEDFTQFDADDLPSNSDVALVLSGYLASMERWRSMNVKVDSGVWVWVTSDGPAIPAARPTRFSVDDK